MRKEVAMGFLLLACEMTPQNQHARDTRRPAHSLPLIDTGHQRVARNRLLDAGNRLRDAGSRLQGASATAGVFQHDAGNRVPDAGNTLQDAGSRPTLRLRFFPYRATGCAIDIPYDQMANDVAAATVATICPTASNIINILGLSCRSRWISPPSNETYAGNSRLDAGNPVPDAGNSLPAASTPQIPQSLSLEEASACRPNREDRQFMLNILARADAALSRSRIISAGDGGATVDLTNNPAAIIYQNARTILRAYGLESGTMVARVKQMMNFFAGGAVADLGVPIERRGIWSCEGIARSVADTYTQLHDPDLRVFDPNDPMAVPFDPRAVRIPASFGSAPGMVYDPGNEIDYRNSFGDEGRARLWQRFSADLTYITTRIGSFDYPFFHNVWAGLNPPSSQGRRHGGRHHHEADTLQGAGNSMPDAGAISLGDRITQNACARPMPLETDVREALLALTVFVWRTDHLGHTPAIHNTPTEIMNNEGPDGAVLDLPAWLNPDFRRDAQAR